MATKAYEHSYVAKAISYCDVINAKGQECDVIVLATHYIHIVPSVDWGFNLQSFVLLSNTHISSHSA